MTPTIKITDTVTLTYPSGETVECPLWMAEVELDYLSLVQNGIA